MRETLALGDEWTVSSLRLLRKLRTRDLDLNEAARALRVSPAECDRALWALIGRSPEAAAISLKYRA